MYNATQKFTLFPGGPGDLLAIKLVHGFKNKLTIYQSIWKCELIIRVLNISEKVEKEDEKRNGGRGEKNNQRERERL